MEYGKFINMVVEDVKTASPFRDLFPINEEVLDRIYWDIEKNGYDQSKPIVLWDGHGVVIDGHTRLRAARKSGLYHIPVVLKYFADEENALQYAIGSQRNRRNLKDGEILKCIEELDRRRNKMTNLMQNRTEAQDCASGKSSQETAGLLGISARKVEQVRTIMDNASDNVKSAVQSGKMSINAAYNQTVNARKGIPLPTPLAEDEKEKLDRMFELVRGDLDQRLCREFIRILVENILKVGTDKVAQRPNEVTTPNEENE